MGDSFKKGQIRDNSISWKKLEQDLLNGSDLNVTGGNNNATITGLADGVNPNDAVNKSQLDAFVNGLAGGVQLRGDITAAADLTGSSTGNTYADGAAGYMQGDLFCVKFDGDITVSDGTLAVNAGDKFYVNKDVADKANIVLADLEKQDNTEIPTIDNLTSTSTTEALSAAQGKILKDLIDKEIADSICNEAPAMTIDGTNGKVALANEARAGSIKVYLNGQRIMPGDFTVAVVGGVSEVTLTNANHVPFETGDCVLVDYMKV